MSTPDYYSKMMALVDAHHSVGQSPFLHSAPGNGKSSFAAMLAGRTEVDFGGERRRVGGYFEVRLGGRDPRDFIGIPVRGTTTVGDATFQVTEDTVPKWALAAAAAGADGSIVYIEFDEVTHATEETQLALQDIILERRLPNGFPLPETTRFILAGNLRDDVAAVNELTESLAARLVHYEFSPPLTDWLSRLTSRGFPGDNASQTVLDARAIIAAYLTENPEDDCESNVDRTGPWANRRSWTRLADAIAALGGDSDAIAEAVLATIGPRVGGKFIAFAMDNIPSPDDLLARHATVAGLDGVRATTALRRAIDTAAADPNPQRLIDAVEMCNTTAAIGPAYADVAVGAMTALSAPLSARGLDDVYGDQGWGGVKFSDALRAAAAR